MNPSARKKRRRLDLILLQVRDFVVLIRCHYPAGPISGVREAEFVLKNTTGVHGFYGASSMERLPVEEAITGTIRLYKSISIR